MLFNIYYVVIDTVLDSVSIFFKCEKWSTLLMVLYQPCKSEAPMNLPIEGKGEIETRETKLIVHHKTATQREE